MIRDVILDTGPLIALMNVRDRCPADPSVRLSNVPSNLVCEYRSSESSPTRPPPPSRRVTPRPEPPGHLPVPGARSPTSRMRIPTHG